MLKIIQKVNTLIDLSKWGFEGRQVSETLTQYKGIGANAGNGMSLRNVLKGIYLFDIRLPKQHKYETTTSQGTNGFRIAFCEEGYYTSNIQGNHVFISANEVFVGKSSPLSMMSESRGPRLKAFNIQIVPSELEDSILKIRQGDDLLGVAPMLEKLLEKLRRFQQVGFTMRDDHSNEAAKRLMAALDSGDEWLIRILTFEMLHIVTTYSISSEDEAVPINERDVNEKVRRIERHIRDHYAEPLKLYDIYKNYQISKNTLNTYFKMIFQYSPHEYLSYLRMRKAQEFLKNTDFSVNKVAELVGFNNSSNFARAFKSYCGESPRSFRVRSQGYDDSAMDGSTEQDDSGASLRSYAREQGEEGALGPSHGKRGKVAGNLY